MHVDRTENVSEEDNIERNFLLFFHGYFKLRRGKKSKNKKRQISFKFALNFFSLEKMLKEEEERGRAGG